MQLLSTISALSGGGPKQTSYRPTNKTIAAAMAAAVAAPLATIIVGTINGVGFGCWADPSVISVACAHHLSDTMSGAITAVFTGATSALAGYIVPPSQSDHVVDPPPAGGQP